MVGASVVPGEDKASLSNSEKHDDSRRKNKIL